MRSVNRWLLIQGKGIKSLDAWSSDESLLVPLGWGPALGGMRERAQWLIRWSALVDDFRTFESARRGG
jgi:hypothetical protein